MKLPGYFLLYTSLLVFEFGIVKCELDANTATSPTPEVVPTEPKVPATPSKPKKSENENGSAAMAPNTIQTQINHFVEKLKLNRSLIIVDKVNGTICNESQGHENCNQTTEQTFDYDMQNFLESILKNENSTLTKILSSQLNNTEYFILTVVASLNVLIVLSLILFYCCPCLQKRALGSLSRAAFDMRLYENVRTHV